MTRRSLSSLLLVLGMALLVAFLGQVGFMLIRQHQMRSRWNSINVPSGSKTAAAAAPLRLMIPSIHLDDAVVRGTSYEDLLVAPGLLEGSPLPGKSGNTVIAGHRDTFFRHVADLQPGDAIEVRSGPREFDYRVFKREIIPPSETSVLAPTPKPQLTLVTCYPTYWVGPAPKRLIVEAMLVSAK